MASLLKLKPQLDLSLSNNFPNKFFATEPSLIRTLEDHDRSIEQVMFSANGHFALTSSNDDTAKMWKIETGELLHTFELESGIPRLEFTPDNRFVVIGSVGSLKIFEIESGDLVHFLEFLSIQDIAISPDSQYILAGGWDGSAILWEIETGNSIHDLIGHTDSIESVTFSSDGRFALTGSRDGSAKLWDVKTGSLVVTLLGHSDGIESVAFSPNGQYALTGSRDNTAAFWLIGSSDTLLELACTRIVRDFTDLEREEFDIPSVITDHPF